MTSFGSGFTEVVRNIPILGDSLLGPEAKAPDLPEPPKLEEKPEKQEPEERITALPDPEDPVAQARRRRAAAQQQAGAAGTIMGGDSYGGQTLG